MNHYAFALKNSERLVLLYLSRLGGEMDDVAFVVRYILAFKSDAYGYAVLDSLEAHGLIAKHRAGRTMGITMTRKGADYVSFFYDPLGTEAKERIVWEYQEHLK